MDSYGRIFQHLLHQNFLTGTAYMLTHKVGSLHTLFHFIGNHISPVTSRESHNKGEVTFLYSGNADFQMFFDLQRNIVSRICGRFAVFISIDAEEGKISGMAGPHPVVCVGSEFTNRRGGSTYHANIAVYGLYKHIIFISSVKSFKFKFGCRSDFYIFIFGEAFCYFAQVAWRQIISTVRIFIFLQLIGYVTGYIKDTVNKSDGQSRCGKFCITVHSPESFCQVIMLYVTMLLDSSVTTMMIGEYQSFRRNDFSGTSATEVYNSIFQREAIGIVYLFNRNLQTEFPHGNCILCFQVS